MFSLPFWTSWVALWAGWAILSPFFLSFFSPYMSFPWAWL